MDLTESKSGFRLRGGGVLRYEGEAVKVDREELHRLIKVKLERAGLMSEHASVVADVLCFADARGVHSHGAVRVEYYAERIAKGGINCRPRFSYQQLGPGCALLDADNGSGHVACKQAMGKAIDLATKVGLAAVGIRRMSHSGALGYFVNMAANAEMVALSVCQSDPMVVPFGGAEEYFGTNPIAFAAPSADGRTVLLDMATSVQAWGKVLHARSRGERIPEGWAVDREGLPTTDPQKVNALLPIAGPKGSGLMMMVDILSGVLLGLPFGRRVSSMYADLTKGRELGQLHLVINPSFFTDSTQFKVNLSRMLDELHHMRPGQGFSQVYYPGELESLKERQSARGGIEVVDSIYQYLVSEEVHRNAYHGKNRFAE